MTGNLFDDLPARGDEEEFKPLLERAGVRIERIVSHAHVSPPGFWYDQPHTEWVLMLRGSAGVLIDGEADPRKLAPGDHVLLEPHMRHRVEWTDANEPTIWLAVHIN